MGFSQANLFRKRSSIKCPFALPNPFQQEKQHVQNRSPEHATRSLFIDRWSPRAFSGEPIDDATLFSFFEAAR